MCLWHGLRLMGAAFVGVRPEAEAAGEAGQCLGARSSVAEQQEIQQRRILMTLKRLSAAREQP